MSIEQRERNKQQPKPGRKLVRIGRWIIIGSVVYALTGTALAFFWRGTPTVIPLAPWLYLFKTSAIRLFIVGCAFFMIGKIMGILAGR